jgi:hypothetical protein
VTGVRWRVLPREIGCSGVTAWRRLRDGRAAGVWERLDRELLRWLNALRRLGWSARGGGQQPHPRAWWWLGYIALGGRARPVASIGYGSTLLLQEELLATVPRSLTWHALGLHSCGLLTMQAVGASLARAVARRRSPSTTMTCLAVASIAVTLIVVLDAPDREQSRDILAPAI